MPPCRTNSTSTPAPAGGDSTRVSEGVPARSTGATELETAGTDVPDETADPVVPDGTDLVVPDGTADPVVEHPEASKSTEASSHPQRRPIG